MNQVQGFIQVHWQQGPVVVVVVIYCSIKFKQWRSRPSLNNLASDQPVCSYPLDPRGTYPLYEPSRK